MFAIIAPEKIHLPPGTVVKLPGNWQDYQTLVQQLGDRSIPRIKYRPGEILLMSPLPVHGKQAHIIAIVAIVLLDLLGRDYEAFTPITIDLPKVRGIEPDYCFYIDNCAAIMGKDRIAWGIEPPPDLVIEVDVTSYTDVNDYLPYQIPEVWLFKKNRLIIYSWQDDRYIESLTSRYFPNFNVSEIVEECWQMSRDRSTSMVIRELRQKLEKDN
ncbi:Uma2 family endonuclease [Kamptonema sp. UHCC 0994]|uniref:Uma2 family endonuclease n=1 Tax=Kamptonema sp. UHCC 0994 TaxID=3031329 RepID=UPI0023BA36CA|nr:Uma2 family endonuclease [Kamptonema sp. UHCC 0994]MDF0554462.1 Uma2 family endonuclease [Kamptonema sp. UHCC 0994]